MIEKTGGAFMRRTYPDTTCLWRAGGAVALLALGLARPAAAWDNGLARTPPMGWNSWNSFQCNVSEELVKKTADAMVTSGMKDAGYQYVNIDDCWCEKQRDAHGDYVADPKKFPSGIKALADYVHAKGLKLGIYSDAGTRTCAGYPGLKGHEAQDMKKFAAWGIDYIKVDWCNTGGQQTRTAYPVVQDAIQKCGRPIVFSICEWGSSKPWEWAGPVGNLWRTTGDINPSWQSMIGILDQQVGLESYAGPGHWNDPDMMEVGVGSLKPDENRAHFSLWCILAAPLITGTDLRNVKPEIVEILTNKEAIAVDQDSLGVQGAKVAGAGGLEVWAKPLADRSQALVLLNRTAAPAEVTVVWARLGWPAGTTAKVRDLWAHKDRGAFKDEFAATVPSHGVVMIKATPENLPAGNLPPMVSMMVDYPKPPKNADPDAEPPKDYKFTVRALPYASDSRVVQVEILEGQQVLKTFQGGRYATDLRKPAGRYRFTAKATDDKGATVQSEALVVTVLEQRGI
jgi:alpha-galactosidase